MTFIISVFFLLTVLKQYDLKIIPLPAPSYNPHQQLFAEKLTHYPRVIGRKLR